MKTTVQYNQSSSELQDKYDEVGSLFDKVCRQLDALSHFYYQPKPVTKEAKITSVQTEHVGSISLEDIVPVTESNGITVAPEEVCAKKHGRESRLLSKEELSSDDRQRMRRTKKSIDKKEKNMKKYEEKMVARLNPGMGNKYEKEKTLSIIRNDKRVLMSDDNRSRKKMSNAVESAGSGGTTSSTMLFKQLQDEAIQSIDSKRINQDAKKKKALHA